MGLTVSQTMKQTRMRQTIATRLGQSYRDAIHVSIRTAVGLDRAIDLLVAENDGQQRARVGIVDVIVTAVARALIAFPAFNSILDVDGHHLVQEVNVGLAVDTPSGLLVPVLRDVPALSLSELNETRRALTQRVIAWQHKLDDLLDGTFTVSNIGPLGVDEVDPIINPPQTAILGIGQMRRELDLDGEGRLSSRVVATFSLVFDHRVHDGADAARFLRAIAGLIEAPESLRSQKETTHP